MIDVLQDEFKTTEICIITSMTFIYIAEKASSNTHKQSEIPRVEIEDVSGHRPAKITRVSIFWENFQRFKKLFGNTKSSTECNGTICDRSVDISLTDLSISKNHSTTGKFNQ